MRELDAPNNPPCVPNTAADQRNEVEALTDRLHAPDFATLDDAERAELRDLAKAARAHVTAQN